MNAMVSRKTNAYGQSQLESRVASASPHELILMLYEGALVAIANAGEFMANGNIPEKGAAITKAIAIIDEGLKASLNVDAGGEVAQNLLALYDYMTYRLFTANLKNDREALNEVTRLLLEIKSAWHSIGDSAQNAQAMVLPKEPPKMALHYGAA